MRERVYNTTQHSTGVWRECVIIWLFFKTSSDFYTRVFLDLVRQILGLEARASYDNMEVLFLVYQEIFVAPYD